MPQFSLSDIVLVKFPFTDLETVKKRPALILSSNDLGTETHLYVIAMITSRVEGKKLKGDLLLHDWEKEGLLFPSILRLGKIVTIEGKLIERKLGTLTAKDFIAAKKNFKEIFTKLIGS